MFKAHSHSAQYGPRPFTESVSPRSRTNVSAISPGSHLREFNQKESRIHHTDGRWGYFSRRGQKMKTQGYTSGASTGHRRGGFHFLIHPWGSPRSNRPLKVVSIRCQYPWFGTSACTAANDLRATFCDCTCKSGLVRRGVALLCSRGIVKPETYVPRM